ncbi:hypothetical protein [Candidatus Avelusimicrobium aviculae]|uniref:hypothetical protein n=1 Tax=Candidatus Avelusimicrobium aviculae TaxID=3416206 RepID=UPI003D119883
MKKLLGLFLALAMSFPAGAAIVDNVEAIGRIDVIGADANRGTLPASAGSRVVAGLSADLTEDVKANVQFWYATDWDGSLAGGTLNEYQDTIRLAEANVVLSNLFDCFELTLGRQFYGDEDSMTMYFGPKSGYMAAIAAQPLSLEAAKLTYADDFKSVTLLAGKTTDDLALTTKYNIYGADIRLNLTDTMKAQVYGYALKDEDNAPEYQGFYGAKLAYMPEAFGFSVEAARGHQGNRLVKEGKDTPYFVKLDASLNMDAFTPRAAFLYQKGIVSEYGSYAPGLVTGKYLTPLGNTSDVIDNARIFNVGVDYKWNKMVFALDGFAFQDRTAQAAATLEADLTATYQHNESVELFAGIGYAKLGGDLKDQFDAKDATVYQLGTTIRF